MSHPLDSARERLKRADENIRNLSTELSVFLSAFPVVSFKGINPVFSQQDRDALEQLKQHVINSPIVPRFSVLTGEIVHHLRSAFDHLAWQLSSATFRSQFPTQIEFPVFLTDPASDSDKLRQYERRLKGIKSASALARIKKLQPYARHDAFGDPLWLIHDMDRIDKHRELVIVVHALTVHVSAGMTYTGQGDQRPYELKPRSFRPTRPIGLTGGGQVSAQVVFREFGTRTNVLVIQALQELLDFASKNIESFAREF